MIRTIYQLDDNFHSELERLLHRERAVDLEIENKVNSIISQVYLRRDEGLIDFTNSFDHRNIKSISDLEISRDMMDKSINSIPRDLKMALIEAAERIRFYHQHEVQQSWTCEQSDGTRLGQKITAIERVGVYVPGGKAAYPSSVLMTVIPAKVVGVKEVVMTVPAPYGYINPSIIAAAHLAGVDRIFTIGGAQAIAALAYGTETIPSVDKIVGPGNIYVSTAKKQVFGKVGIDIIAGPSEIVIICDQSVSADWVAMDLIAQAEHDELAQSIAITNNHNMAKKINQAISKILPNVERKNIIEKSLRDQGAIIVVKSLNDALEISNFIAPEHLELMVKNAKELENQVQNAGAIFIGRYSAESLGDYCVGPNHVLPTSGSARFSSPLGVYDYQKRTNVIEMNSNGAKKIAKIASILARYEGLTAHAYSAEYRLRSIKSSKV